MDNFESIFRAYGGDYPTTMARFMGKEDLYMKIFGMFFKDDNLKQLGASIQEGDLETAFVAAHTLKGVAGNLGLTPFYEAVCRMVEPVRKREERDDYLDMYGEIEAEYGRVVTLWGDLQALQ